MRTRAIGGALAVLVATAPAAAEVAVLRQVRPIIAADTTRLVFDTSRRVEYTLREVPGDPASGVPPRLYLDFPSTRLAPDLPRTFIPTGGPLRRLRSAQLPGGLARIVFDVPGLRAHRVFALLDPFRLVVDVEGDPRPVPVAVARVEEPPPNPLLGKEGGKGPERDRVSLLGTEGGNPVPLLTKEGLGEVSGERPTSPKLVASAKPVPSSPRGDDRSSREHRPRIVLDPGHGGKDPGAIGAGGVVEKDVVLQLCLRLKRRLEVAGFEVLMTRDRDVFLSLEERTARANAAHPDLFVSVHANASHDTGASGIETYYLSNSGDRATIRLAQMENQLAHMTGMRTADSDVSWIVSDMIQSYKVEESSRLANVLQSDLIGAARKGEPGVRDLGAKPGPFYVLVGAGMPAVLVEVGFVTHADEGRRIAADDYQGALTDGLVYGIGRFVDSEIARTL